MDDERDEIDELVDWQLSQKPPLGKNHTPWACPNCRGQWHGVAVYGCPGSHIDLEGYSPEPPESPPESPKTIASTLPAIPDYYGFC